MEILTEFDALQDAMSKINMNESVMPYVNGRLVDDGSYNKIQKILNCPEMVSCHKYLYNLDLDQLNEDEIDKVDKLYKLGCDRGFIIDDLTKWDDDSIDDATAKITGETPADEPKVEEPSAEKPIAGTLFKAKIPCWTIIYSATSKDGEIKTGEAYSNAISAAAAKADVKSKLSNIGYSNITILAIESCEADVEATSFKEELAEADDKDDAEKEDKAEEKTEEKTEEEPKEENKEEDDTADDSSDDSSEDSSDEDTSSDDSKEDDTGSEDDVSDEEDKADDTDEDTADDSSDEESADEESDDEASDDADASDDEDGEDELDANEKAELKDKYKKTFKNTLVKCKFTKSFNDLTLEEKVKFFTQLSKSWTKNEPNEFMTDKEIEQLNNVVVNPEGDED